MRKALSLAFLPLALSACGGGGDGGTAPPTPEASTISLSGVVSDGPIAGAQVCLLVDGVQARNAAGAAICSSSTDADGNYVLEIPTDLQAGFLTLAASKGGDVKLASSLGSKEQLLAAAGSARQVSPANLPATRVTHFTTADFALADTDKDGQVSKAEFDAYVADFAKVREVAAIVKAVIDYGQGSALLGGETRDTLQLASAAAHGDTLGTTGQTAQEWAADADNAEVLAAVDGDVTGELADKFLPYTLSTVVTSHQIPQTISLDNGTHTLSCEVGTSNETLPAQVAVDQARGVFILKIDGEVMTGSYDPRTGAVRVQQKDPLAVSLVSNLGTTYWSEGEFKLEGTVNTSNGSFSGTYSEMIANTWSLSSDRQVCKASGTVTATKS